MRVVTLLASVRPGSSDSETLLRVNSLRGIFLFFCPDFQLTPRGMPGNSGEDVPRVALAERRLEGGLAFPENMAEATARETAWNRRPVTHSRVQVYISQPTFGRISRT